MKNWWIYAAVALMGVAVWYFFIREGDTAKPGEQKPTPEEIAAAEAAKNRGGVASIYGPVSTSRNTLRRLSALN